ncbi:hypothetical protein Trydic_g16813 [Trypoxylus dichotomus]
MQLRRGFNPETTKKAFLYLKNHTLENLFEEVILRGAALRCFQCLGSLTGDCFNAVVPAMIPAECDPTTMNLPENLKHVRADAIVTKCISHVINLLGMVFIERTCGYIWEDMDICEYMVNEQGLQLYSCSSCNTDFCNTEVFST